MTQCIIFMNDKGFFYLIPDTPRIDSDTSKLDSKWQENGHIELKTQQNNPRHSPHSARHQLLGDRTVQPERL